MRRAVFWLLFLLVILWMIQGWLLPFYLEKHLLPNLAFRAGLPDFSCPVRHIGLFGLELGPIALGHDDDPALRAATVFVSYSVPELARRQLRDIHISGLKIYLKRHQGKFALGPIPLFPPDSSVSLNEKEESGGSFHLPVRFSRVTIDSSEIIYQDNKRTIHLPFQGKVVASGNQTFDVDANCRVGEGNLDWEGRVDLSAQTVGGGIDLRGLSLAQAAGWADAVIPGLPGGEIDAQGEFKLGLHPFAIRNASGELHLHQINWCQGSFSMVQDGIAKIHGRWSNDKKIDADMSPFSFRGTVAGTFAMSALSVDLKNSEPALEGQWSLDVQELLLPDQAVNLNHGLAFRGSVSGESQPGTGWKLAIQGQKTFLADDKAGDLNWPEQGVSVWTGENRFACTVAGGSAATRFDCEAGMDKLQGTFAQGRMQVDEVRMRASMQAAPGKDAAGEFESRLSLAGKGLKMNAASFQAVLPEFHLFAENVPTDGPAAAWRGDIRTGGGRLENTNQALRLEKISFYLPWQFPVTGPPQHGRLGIGKLVHQGRDLGSIQAGVDQQRKGWSWKGSWRDILLPGTVLHFNGQAEKDFSQANMNYVLDRPAFALGTALGAYVPRWPFEARGDLHLAGEVRWKNQQLSGPARFSLKNIDGRDPKRQLHCQGAALNMDFADLFTLHYAERPRLTFESLSLADVVLKKGEVSFLLDRNLELLIEKLTFGWAGGRVFAESFRLRPELERLDVALYCDRVKLVEVFEQLGAGRAEGTGSLNGRIPVHYENGLFSVENGFLFSTPGEGGILHISAMESIAAGLPGNDRASGQLQLAEAALQDYEYKWARLAVNSEDDDLLIEVQLDGRPNKPLPFVYRKEFGGFVRAEADFAGTKFEGIRLDLNFRLPLNQLLEYKNIFKLMNQ